MAIEHVKSIIRNTPLIGPLAVRFAKSIGYRQKTEPYHFKREEYPREIHNPGELGLVQVKNLLEYTKTSGNFYAATNFPAGYHTLRILETTLPGRRNPAERLALIDYDFSNKTVLDIGTNQGGMLFELAHQLKWGVGIDYDKRMVNAAQKIRSVEKHTHLDFYHFDLEKEPLSLIKDLLPETRVDVVFLLAVCRWIKNWREVISFAAEISDTLLIELNSVTEQEKETQKQYFEAIYDQITLVSGNSLDDPERNDRTLYLCRK